MGQPFTSSSFLEFSQKFIAYKRRMASRLQSKLQLNAEANITSEDLHTYLNEESFRTEVENWHNEHLFHHRYSAVNRLKEIQNRHKDMNVITGKNEAWSKYMTDMCNSKIFVSPWGVGEWSGKDEEASWCGTILIKPGASWFRSSIPVYDEAVDVRSDFSDLEEVVTGLLNDPKGLQERGDRINRLFQHRHIGYYDLLQQPAVLEEYAAALRPLVEKKKKQQGKSVVRKP